MKIVRIIHHIQSSIRRYNIRWCLLYLKPYLLSGGKAMGEMLSRQNIHCMFVAKPFLIFGKKNIEETKIPDRKAEKVLFQLCKLIKQGPFVAKKDKDMLASIDIQDYLTKDIARLFQDNRHPMLYEIPYCDLSNEKIAVYTALTGGYDDVPLILYKQPGIDYYLFTNNKELTSEVWKVVYVDSPLDNVLLSREIKMLPNKYLPSEYTESIYLDANAILYGDIGELCGFLNSDVAMAVTQHYERNTIADEINACVACGKLENENQALMQYQKYLDDGFKDDMGLAECTILIRRHNDENIIRLMELWWKEFRNGVKRDQLSLLPCVQKLGIQSFRIIPGCVWANQYVTFNGHKSFL